MAGTTIARGMVVMVALAAALQFLLLSPAFIRRTFTPAEMGRATAFYPLVGALLGGILAGADALLAYIFPIAVRSALVLAVWIVLTGGLHFDGLLDAADGLFGGSTREHRLQIMRDEHTGAFGAAAGVLILLTMFSALSALPDARWPALVMAPLLGRCGLSLSIATLPYARRDGLGWDIKENTRPTQAVIAASCTLTLVALIGWLSQPALAAAAVLAALIVGVLVSRFVMRRLAGMTGDTYGALNMLIEVGVLLTFAVAA